MRPAFPDPECVDPRLVDVYRKMSPAERLAAAFDATRFVRSRLEAHLSGRAGWTPEQVQSEVARRFLRGSG